jgi:fluoride exporter
MNALLVAVGGAAGSLVRWAVNLAFGDRAPGGFPWATLLINVAGCLVIGLVLGRQRLSAGATLLLATGFCGGFTTFSSFAYEAHALVQNGAWQRALLYVLLSNVLGFAAVLLGVTIAKA